jgi:hypothetical protein
VLGVTDATEHKGILYPGVVFSEQGPRDSKFPRGSKIRRHVRGGAAAAFCVVPFSVGVGRALVSHGGGGCRPLKKTESSPLGASC